MAPGGKTYQSINNIQLIQNSRKTKAYEINPYIQAVVNVMFTHMSEKERMKIFGETAVEAMVKKLQQPEKLSLESKPVVIPIYPKYQQEKEKVQTLEAVTLIQENRDG